MYIRNQLSLLCDLYILVLQIFYFDYVSSNEILQNKIL